MPQKPPLAATRTLVWRKVHARLAVLGLRPAQIFDAVLDDIPPTRQPVQFARVLKHPQRIDADRRRRFETALCLPLGALDDSVPLIVTTLAPVPAAYQSEGGSSPAPAIDALQPQVERLKVACGSTNAGAVLVAELMRTTR